MHAGRTVGQPGAVMCSTNRVNGVDACMNPTYLEGFLRQRFNFSGYVVTDGGSCGNPNCRATVARQNASAAQSWGTVGHEIAAELCLSAGTDIELGTTLSTYSAGAIAAELIPAQHVSRSNIRMYSQIIAQGHLETVPDDKLGSHSVDTAFARELAFDGAVQSMVLLKNEGGLLPLDPSKPLRIALIGPHLNSTADLLSSHGYAGQNKLVLQNTIEAAFQRRIAATNGRVQIVGMAIACDITMGCASADLAAVRAAVAQADVIIAFVGLHPSTGVRGVPIFYVCGP
jgi:beta-D-xylosidase 4